jgi:hypothetical protein
MAQYEQSVSVNKKDVSGINVGWIPLYFSYFQSFTKQHENELSFNLKYTRQDG